MDICWCVVQGLQLRKKERKGALALCAPQGLAFEMMDTSFFVGRVTIVPERGSRFGRIRRAVFAAMHRNAQSATEFFRIPPNRVIELGGQVEI